MPVDGYLNFDTKIDTDGFEGGIKNINGHVKTFESTLGKVGKTLKTAFNVAAVVTFGKKLVSSAAEVKAAGAQFEQTFGDMQDAANAAIDRVADPADILAERLRGSATQIYAFAKTAKMETSTAMKFMEDSLQVAADSAAYYDKSIEDTTATLQSFLKGNYANDAALGLSATETTRNAKAMELYGKKFMDLTEAQKQLTLLEMVKEANALSGAMGQAAREADGWANVTGNLSAVWDRFLGVIGQPVLQLMVPVIQQITAALENLTAHAITAYNALAKAFGWGEKQVEPIKQAATAQGQVTDAVEETNDAQEGALAGFDEIQTLATGTAEATEATADATAENLTAAAITDVAPTEEKTVDTSWVDAFVEKLQTLKNELQPIRAQLQYLWDALTPLQTFNSQALSDFYNLFLVPVGAWTMGEGIPRFIDIVSNGFSMIEWDSLNLSLADLFGALVPFSENVGEGLLWLFENVFIPFGTWVMNDAAPVFIGLLSTAFETFNAIYETARPGLEWIWSNWLVPLAEWTGGKAVEIINDFTRSFEDMQKVIQGDMTILELIERMSDAEIIILSITASIALVCAALAAYNAVATIAAVATGAITAPVVLVVAAIAALIAIIVLCIKHWDDIKAAAIAAWNYIVDCVVGSVKTFNQNVIIPLGEMFVKLWENIKSWASSAWNWIVDVFKGLGDWFNTKVIQPISKFFSSLWDGIRNMFKNGVNGIIGFLNGMIDGVVSGFNTAIRAINSIRVTIPDWVPVFGGRSFGTNLRTITAPRIPYLATGAVIPPNREFLAVLGDQTSGTNIEAPLETILEAFRTALRENGGAHGSQTVILKLDRREFGRAVIETGNEETHRIGLKVVTE